MRARFVAVAVFLIGVIIASGLVGYYMLTLTTITTSSTATAITPSTLTIEDAYFPQGYLNPLRVYEVGWPSWTEYTVYQPLVVPNATAEFKENMYQFLPALATNWIASADGTTYTYNLRHVHFSNGDPFNAYQVWTQLYGYYYLSGNSSSWVQSLPLFDMSHVNFGLSTISLLAQSGLTSPNQEAMSVMTNSSWPIYVTGSYQIVLRLRVAMHWDWMGALNCNQFRTLYDAQYMLEHGGLGTPTAPNSYFDTHPLPGTGPYIIAEESMNSFVKFVQNPNYWGQNLTQSEIAGNPYLDPGHIKNVDVLFESDDVARYTDLSTGAAQIAAIESGDWRLITANPDKYGYVSIPPWGGLIWALALNTKDYPTNITAVRQAIVHAINYTDISQSVFFGQISPFVGPEYPGWKDFYDLGNLSPYEYNISLARQILANANITTASFPPFLFRVIAFCPYCIDTAQIVQADLAQIGITVNIDVVAPSEIDAVYGSYASQIPIASQIGQIAILGDVDWGPDTLTPAGNWLEFVSNESTYGNYATYYNPTVEACADSYFSGATVGQIQTLCKRAQAQIYEDAPYTWVGTLHLWYGAGSLVWDKNVVKSFQVDPNFSGSNTIPIFNTVTFVS